MSRLRFGIPTIGGAQWMGGWNYMLNLVATLATQGPEDLAVTVLAGTDVRCGDLDTLRALPRTDVVYDDDLVASQKPVRLAQAILGGVDPVMVRLARAHAIDVMFEPAQFFGWRAPFATLAWLPDFQHRRLPHLFSRSERLRREIGFRAQIVSGRTIMLSSEAAERDCIDLYPATNGRTVVARFSAPATTQSLAEALARVSAAALPQRYFFVPNQLWVHKNHALVIEAAAALRAMGDCSLIVATGHGGDARVPDLRARLAERIGVLDLGEQVILLDGVPYADVQAMALNATALINPSRYEGWSTTVEEAKAVGTPLILSNIAVHREQVGAQGQFFDVDDADRLAAIVHVTPTRDADRIAIDRANAATLNPGRQQEFAAAVAAAVRKAAATRRF